MSNRSDRALRHVHAQWERNVLTHDLDGAFTQLAALEWEMQAMREDDHHPDFETVWIPTRMSVVSAAIMLARALRLLAAVQVLAYEPDDA